MVKFVEKTLRELEDAIRKNEKEPNGLKRVCRNIQLAKRAVAQVIDAVNSDANFRLAPDIQIEFYRHLFPPLLSKWLFLGQCYALEIIQLTSSGKEKEELLKAQIGKAKEFFFHYKPFIQYFLSEDTSRDKEWFTATASGADKIEAEDGFQTGIQPNCLLAAYALAYHDFAGLLHLELHGGPPDAAPTASAEKAVYEGDTIILTELAMLLYTSGAFKVNGKRATERYFFELMEREFSVKIKNPNQRIQDLKRRNEPLAGLKRWSNILNAYLANLPEDRERRRLH